MRNAIIVSRHPATLSWIARQLGGEHLPGNMTDGLDACIAVPSGEYGGREYIPVYTGSVAAADVTGRVVYGNIPLHLCALALEVWAVEFTGAPPRGTEYGIAEMDAQAPGCAGTSCGA